MLQLGKISSTSEIFSSGILNYNSAIVLDNIRPIPLRRLWKNPIALSPYIKFQIYASSRIDKSDSCCLQVKYVVNVFIEEKYAK